MGTVSEAFSIDTKVGVMPLLASASTFGIHTQTQQHIATDTTTHSQTRLDKT